MRKQKHLTPEQVQKIVAEVEAWNVRTDGTLWSKVRWVTRLELPGEWYHIRFENDIYDVFKRNKEKNLRPILGTTYFGPHWTDIPRPIAPKQEEEQTKPEE